MTKKYCTDRSHGDWNIHGNDDGTLSVDRIQVLVMSDVLRELRTLNRLLACPNFIGIPSMLRRISSNTAKPRKAAKKRKRSTSDRGEKR